MRTEMTAQSWIGINGVVFALIDLQIILFFSATKDSSPSRNLWVIIITISHLVMI